MSGIKAFVNKIKTKSRQYQAEQNEKKAKAKGFSSFAAYQTFSGAAKHEGEEIAKSELRKKELKRIKDEAKQEVLLGKTGKYSKVQKKVQKGFETFEKGAGVYNEIMGGLQSLNSSNSSNDMDFFNGPKQRKTKSKKSKKSKSKRQNNFWDQYR